MIKIKYLMMCTALTLFTSCSDDDLYQNPSTSLSDETVVNSYETAKTVLMGAYSQTEHYQYLTIGQIGLDVMGQDEMLSSGEYGFSTYKWNVYSYDYQQYPKIVDGWWSAYASYLWNHAYRAITACNLLINSTLPTGCEELVAQAHAVRAWNFMNLYHLFCPAYNNATLGGDNGKGLFLRLTQATADVTEDVERSNLKTSLDQIISDFKYTYDNSTETSNYYFNHKNAALFLARMYLEMNNYSEASKYAEEAASNTFDGSNLMSKEDYQSGFMTANSEWLFGFQFDSETTNIYASIPSFYHGATYMDSKAVFGTTAYGSQVPGNNVSERTAYLAKNATDYMKGYSTIRFAKSFVDIFSKDANGIFTDCRALFPFYISDTDGYFTSKYNNNGSLGVADFPAARIAEAYLIESEAKYKLGDSATGLSVLNTLQNKRGGSVSASINIDEIWKERRRELYGEGFALTDLKRLQKPLERTGADQWSSVKHLDANSPRMMYPIPDDELLYNPYYKIDNTAYNKGQNDYWAK